LIFRARLRFLSVVAQLSQDEATMVRERMFLHKLNSALVQVRGDVTVAGALSVMSVFVLLCALCSFCVLLCALCSFCVLCWCAGLASRHSRVPVTV
jgi:hypothetical protein